MQNKKVSKAFGWLCVFIIALGAFGIISVNHIADSRRFIYRDTLWGLENTAAIKSQVQELRILARDIALSANDPESARNGRYTASRNLSDIDSLIKRCSMMYEDESNSEAMYLLDIIRSEFDDVRSGFSLMTEEAIDKYSYSDDVWKLYAPIEDSMTKIDDILDELIDTRSRTIRETKDDVSDRAFFITMAMLVAIGIVLISLMLLYSCVTGELVDPVCVLLKYVRALNGEDVRFKDTDIETMTGRYQDHSTPISKLIFQSIVYWHKIGVLHNTLDNLDLPPQRMPVVAAKDVSTALDNMVSDTDEITSRTKAVAEEIQWLVNASSQHMFDVQNTMLMVCGMKSTAGDGSRMLFSMKGKITEPIDAPLHSAKHIYDQDNPGDAGVINSDGTGYSHEPHPDETVLVGEPSFEKRHVQRHFIIDNETQAECPAEEAMKHIGENGGLTIKSPSGGEIVTSAPDPDPAVEPGDEASNREVLSQQ